MGLMGDRDLIVGFVCEAGDALGPTAEALAREMSEGAVAIERGALHPAGRLQPTFVTALREIGIDTGELSPDPIDRTHLEDCEVVVALGLDPDDHALFEGLDVVAWDLEAAETGQLADVRAVRDEIAYRVRQLLRDRGVDVEGRLSQLG